MMPEFMVHYTFHGRSIETVEAESLEEAQRIIAERCEAEDFELDADEIDDVDFHIQPIARAARSADHG